MSLLVRLDTQGHINNQTRCLQLVIEVKELSLSTCETEPLVGSLFLWHADSGTRVSEAFVVEVNSERALQAAKMVSLFPFIHC